MNKVIRDYPVDRLPADLQEGLPEHGLVEIELRIRAVGSDVRLADLAGSIPNVHGTEEEVIRHIRKLRGEE